jgi:hypothetical protein
MDVVLLLDRMDFLGRAEGEVFSQRGLQPFSRKRRSADARIVFGFPRRYQRRFDGLGLLLGSSNNNRTSLVRQQVRRLTESV